jgi:hypothetical protein
MTDLKRLCAGFVLTLTLALPALAGHIPCPGEAPPPPPPESSAEATAEGDMSAGVMAVLLNLLSVF